MKTVFASMERWFRRHSIRNLMTYVVGGMLVVFLMDFLLPSLRVESWLHLNWHLVMRGQVWRLLTFVLLPPSSSLVWILFSLYFYWLIGNALENHWGTARFNMFYFVGILGNILAAAITGSGTNTYLNLSLFLAFAAVYPNFELMLFFFLPVKVKYLALLDVVLYGLNLIVGPWSVRAAIVFSLLNVILFFGGDLISTIRRESSYWKTRANFRRAMRR